MQKELLFHCTKCGNDFSLDQLSPSLQRYGFINLLGKESEIFAVDCLTDNCGSLLKKITRSDDAQHVHEAIQAALDPSSKEGGDYPSGIVFRYFSTIPYSRQSRGILDSCRVTFIPTTQWECSEGITPACNAFHQEKYFISFNHKHYSAFNNNILLLCYEEKIVDTLLEIESNSNIQLFPRYILKKNLFTLFDDFYWSNIIDSLSSETNIPSALYGILCENLYSDPFAIDSQYDPNWRILQHNHNQMIAETEEPFIQGLLNDLLLNHYDIFLNNYTEYFKERKISYNSLWTFKTQFLTEVHKACLSEDIIQKKLRKPIPQQIARVQCEALAKLFWDNDPDITIKEMSGREELVYACRNKYEDDARYDWIKTHAPNRKGGRRPGKK